MQDARQPHEDRTQKTLDTLADLFLTGQWQPAPTPTPGSAPAPGSSAPATGSGSGHGASGMDVGDAGVSDAAGASGNDPPSPSTNAAPAEPATPPVATPAPPIANQPANHLAQQSPAPVKLRAKPLQQLAHSPIAPVAPIAQQHLLQHLPAAEIEDAPSSHTAGPVAAMNMGTPGDGQRQTPPTETPLQTQPQTKSQPQPATDAAAPALPTAPPASPHIRMAGPTLPTPGDAQNQTTESDHAEPVATIRADVEAVLLGNLPGLAGPWATQYAQAMADGGNAPVLLIHADEQTTSFELIQPNRQAHQLAHDLPRHPADVRPFVQKLVADSLCPVTRVLVRMDTQPGDTLARRYNQLPNWTLLSGADALSIAAAERALTGLAATVDDAHRHRVQLVMAGCPHANARAAARHIAQSLIGHFSPQRVHLNGCIPQMAPARIQPLGAFPSKACDLNGLLNDLAGWSTATDFRPIDLPAPGSGHKDDVAVSRDPVQGETDTATEPSVTITQSEPPAPRPRPQQTDRPTIQPGRAAQQTAQQAAAQDDQDMAEPVKASPSREPKLRTPHDVLHGFDSFEAIGELETVGVEAFEIDEAADHWSPTAWPTPAPTPGSDTGSHGNDADSVSEPSDANETHVSVGAQQIPESLHTTGSPGQPGHRVPPRPRQPRPNQTATPQVAAQASTQPAAQTETPFAPQPAVAWQEPVTNVATQAPTPQPQPQPVVVGVHTTQAAPQVTSETTQTTAPASATAEANPAQLLLSESPAMAGAVVLDARCPMHESVQLVLDQQGRLHLLAHHLPKGDNPRDEDPGVLRDALLDLMAAQRWANEHKNLLALTQRQLRFDGEQAPALHLFTPRADWAAGLNARLGDALKLHLLAKVHVGQQATWFTTPLN